MPSPGPSREREGRLWNAIAFGSGVRIDAAFAADVAHGVLWRRARCRRSAAGFRALSYKAPRRNSITPDRQRAFIAALAATEIVTQAARSIGASLEALYKLRGLAGAEGFAAAWEAAIDRGMARLEDCALERAIVGELRPVVSGGEVVAHYIRHDTQLILFLLRQRRGGRYGREVDLRPGSALYERVRAAIEAERPSQEEIYASIDAKLDLMRARSEAGDGEDPPRDD